MANSIDVDAAVRAIALINALLLLIPVALIGNLQLNVSWGALYTAAHFSGNTTTVNGASANFEQSCKPEDFDLEAINNYMSTFCLCIVDISLVCLLLTLLYFVTKPKNPDDEGKDKDHECFYWLDPALPERGFKEVVEQGADIDIFSVTEREEFNQYRNEFGEDNVKTRLVESYKNKTSLRRLFSDQYIKKLLEDNEKRIEDAVVRRHHWKDPLRLKFAQLCLFRYRAWWRRAKWVFFGMAVGTMFSIGLTLTMISKYFYHHFLKIL
jgi:hypothetical protein